LDMEKISLIKLGLRNSMATAIYVVIVAMIMNNAERIFGTMKNIIGPVAFLLLFVTSAAITGFLVLGQPIMMYVDNQRRDAIKLFIYTVAWLFAFTVIALALNLLW
jgi:hypothetical protein